MRQHDQQAEEIKRMIFAYIDMRSRLDRVDRALGRFHYNTSIQRRLDKIDRDLTRFNCKITPLSLKAAQLRGQRSDRRYPHACSPPDSAA
jgi:hypothetical protein